MILSCILSCTGTSQKVLGAANADVRVICILILAPTPTPIIRLFNIAVCSLSLVQT